MSDYLKLPDTGDLRLRRARVLAALLDMPPPGPVDSSGLIDIDMDIAGGRVTSVAPAGTLGSDGGIDLDNDQIWPCYVDIHTHLDKGHIWPRAPSVDGSFPTAVKTIVDDRTRRWSYDDVKRRADFALRCAYVHGTAALRTHLDVYESQAAISYKVFRDLRDEWAGKIALQATSLVSIDTFMSPFGPKLADMVADAGGNLGCVTRLVHSDHENGMPADLQAMLDNFFKLAEERNLDLDFHVDEGGDPRAVALGFIARTAIKRGFKGKIVTGHCCSLSIQPDQLVKDTLDACADSGLAVASMPTCNMYVQARNAGVTPRWRGVTLLHELRARGVTVTVGSDNTRDSFHEFGDLDMHDTYNQAVRIAHLDYPHTDWPRVVTRTPADVMRLPELGRIKPGMNADLILFHARSMSELLARPQSDRVVLRNGRPIDRKLPDYRELDDLQIAL